MMVGELQFPCFSPTPVAAASPFDQPLAGS